MKADIARQIATATAQRRGIVVLRDLTSGEDQLFTQPNGDPDIDRAFVDGKARKILLDGADLFIQPYLPNPRLLIVGAVHIAQPLCLIAATLDYDVKLIDPRGLYATQERFPGVELVKQWPDEAFEAIGLDGSTAVACLSHDPKLDDPALIAALSAPQAPAYIGALGSRRTQAKRLERLAEQGLSQEQLARIASPIGLDIKAVTPAEIATSIAAEIVTTLRTR